MQDIDYNSYKLYYIPCIDNNHFFNFIVYENEEGRDFELLITGKLNETAMVNDRLLKTFSSTILFSLHREYVNPENSSKFKFFRKILNKLKNIKFIFFNNVFELESFFVYRRTSEDQEFLELKKMAEILHFHLILGEGSESEDEYYYFKEYISKKQIPFLRKIEFILNDELTVFVERNSNENEPFFYFW